MERTPATMFERSSSADFDDCVSSSSSLSSSATSIMSESVVSSLPSSLREVLDPERVALSLVDVVLAFLVARCGAMVAVAAAAVSVEISE